MGGAGWGCWLVGARDERRGVACGEGWSGVHGCCLHKGGGDRGGQGLPAQWPSGSRVRTCRLQKRKKVTLQAEEREEMNDRKERARKYAERTTLKQRKAIREHRNREDE